VTDSAPKKYQCGWCKKKYVSEIRPPFTLPGGVKHGRLGKSHKVAKLGDPIVIQGYAVRAPGVPRFSGSEFACSVKCYRQLTGEDPNGDPTPYGQGTSPDQP